VEAFEIVATGAVHGSYKVTDDVLLGATNGARQERWCGASHAVSTTRVALKQRVGALFLATRVTRATVVARRRGTEWISVHEVKEFVQAGLSAVTVVVVMAAADGRWRDVPFPAHLIHLLVFMLRLVNNIAVEVDFIFLVVIFFLARRHLVFEEFISLVTNDLQVAVMLAIQWLTEHLSDVVKRSAVVGSIFLVIIVVGFIFPISLFHVVTNAGILLIASNFFEVMVTEAFFIFVLFIGARLIIIFVVGLINDFDLHTVAM
jgi:hypothetical protein